MTLASGAPCPDPATIDLATSIVSEIIWPFFSSRGAEYMQIPGNKIIGGNPTSKPALTSNAKLTES
eukprot:1999784-Pyramimonas_sp.AAC.1